MASAACGCRLLLLAVVLLLLAVTPSSAICPEKCACHVYGTKHLADCNNKGFKEPPPFGSETYDYLVLADNKLQELNDDAFSLFPNVQILNISLNAITAISENAFRGLRWLEKLDLSRNILRLEHSLPVKVLAEHGVSWMSLANNKFIGRDLSRTKAEEDAIRGMWLDIPSLQNLTLSGCELPRLPRWMLSGLPGLEFLDISNNKLLMLPVLTLVSTCRLKFIALGANAWDCKRCENFRSNNFLESIGINEYRGNNLCAFKNKPDNCEVALIEEEKNVKSGCERIILPERIVYKEPPSFWFYIAIVAGSIVGLVFLSLIINAVCSSLCKKKRTNVSKPAQSVADQELLQVLPRS